MKSQRTEIPMALAGCDFRTASSAWRERLMSDIDERQRLFAALKAIDSTVGLVVLETCNRVEWLTSSDSPEWLAELLQAEMAERWRDMARGETPIPYKLCGKAAVYHVLRVISGRESMAVGEAQIAGQFQAAVQRAQQEHTASTLLNRLAGSAGRLARAAFEIGFRANHRQGVHGLVAEIVQRRIGRGSVPLTALVVGMGKMGRRTADLLEEISGLNVVRINRTIPDAQRGRWQPLHTLAHWLPVADILVTATGASHSWLTNPEMIPVRKQPRLLVIDIGIPRQVSEVVQTDARVEYMSMDALSDSVRASIEPTCEQKLNAALDLECQAFIRFCRQRHMIHLLREIHRGRRQLVRAEIPEILAKHLPDLPLVKRQALEKDLRHLLQVYSNNLRVSLQDSLAGTWKLPPT